MSRAFEVPRRADLAAMFSLAVPVVVVQVGMMLMGVVDTMVVGRVSAEALAAVALGNLAVMTVSAFAIGLLLALDPVVAQAVGARDQPAIRRAVQRGLLLAAAITIPATLLLLPVEPILTLLRQPRGTVPIAAGYVYRSLPGLLPFFGFVVLRQTLQAHERMRPIVVNIIGPGASVSPCSKRRTREPWAPSSRFIKDIRRRTGSAGPLAATSVGHPCSWWGQGGRPGDGLAWRPIRLGLTGPGPVYGLPLPPCLCYNARRQPPRVVFLEKELPMPAALPRSSRFRPFVSLALALLLAPALFAQSRPSHMSQPVDEEYTRLIKQYTQDPRIITELVDHVRASSTVPSPLEVLGRIPGTPDELTYSNDIYRYFDALDKASRPASPSRSRRSASRTSTDSISAKSSGPIL